jgi:hypothetical protein
MRIVAPGLKSDKHCRHRHMKSEAPGARRPGTREAAEVRAG